MRDDPQRLRTYSELLDEVSTGSTARDGGTKTRRRP